MPDKKNRRIDVRTSAALLAVAKKRTGIESNSELIRFALAKLVHDDDFSGVFKKSRGKVDPSLKLGF
jgi:hypothetical protein